MLKEGEAESSNGLAHTMKPRSNSIGLLAGAIIAVAVMAAASRMDDGSQRLLWHAAFVGFAFVPLAIAIAELRSGYSWKNLAPGNRGVERVVAPRRYWASVAWHAALGGGLIAFGLFATPPNP